jgi:hypothetical protein
MPLSLTIQNEHELHIAAKPDYRSKILNFGPAVFGPLAILLLSGKFVFMFLVVPAIFFATYYIAVQPRERRCVINLKKRIVHFEKNGILNSSIDQFEETLNTEVASIQMMRRIEQSGTWCSIGLLLKHRSQVITISDNDLSFRDCHLFSIQIQEFLGPEIPIVWN